MLSVPIFKSKRLRVEATWDPSNRSIYVSFVGEINEEAKLRQVSGYIFGLPEVKQVILDLGKVEGMNSAGVQEWMFFMDRLEHHVSCLFDSISEVIVDRANSLPGLLGKP